MRISDWSSDVCSSDLFRKIAHAGFMQHDIVDAEIAAELARRLAQDYMRGIGHDFRHARCVHYRVAANHLDRRGRDRGTRPERIDGDTILAEFLGPAKRAKTDRKSTRLNSSH